MADNASNEVPSNPELNRQAYVGGKDSSIRYRIDDSAAFSLFMMAGFFDLLSPIPIVNDIIVLVAQPLFFIFFMMLGVPPIGPRTWIWYVAAWVVELIPLLSILPMFVLLVFRFTAISRLEDKIEIELKRAKINPHSEVTRLMAGKIYAQQATQAYMKQREEKAIWEAGAKRDKHGKIVDYDKDKMQQKRTGLNERRADLDKAFAPGASAAANERIAASIKGSPQDLRPNKQTSNAAQPNIDGMVPPEREPE